MFYYQAPFVFRVDTDGISSWPGLWRPPCIMEFQGSGDFNGAMIHQVIDSSLPGDVCHKNVAMDQYLWKYHF